MGSAGEIKKFLRENGIETSNIRVSSGSSIRVKLLDPRLDYEKIDNLVKEKYESYRTDEATGEILQGGNTFVFVEYDYDLVKEVGEELSRTIRPFLEKCTGQWSIQLLVRHYIEHEEYDYNVHIVKRAIQEALYHFLRNNEGEIPGLTIDGWN